MGYHYMTCRAVGVLPDMEGVYLMIQLVVGM